MAVETDAPAAASAAPSYKKAMGGAVAAGLVVGVAVGVAGLYAARRLVKAGEFQASEVCVFEATERVGGRTYSVRYGDRNLVVDAGAYRTWPEYTPVTHALITQELGLTVACYDPSEVPCEKYVVVDSTTGHNVGLATYVERLADDLFAAGARWFPRHQLDAVKPSGSGLELKFMNGVEAKATKTLLNIPQRPLLEVLRASSAALSLDGSTFDAAHAVQTEIVQKLYLYYESAWWKELGLSSGEFNLPGDATDMLLKGRYHDGDVVCEDNDPTKCHGFLLAVYAHDYAGESAMFFRRYQRDRPEPITIISDSTAEGKRFLEHCHDRLVEYHVYAENASYTNYEAQSIVGGSDTPTFAVLATWNIATLGAGGGWHGWTDLSLSDAMPEALSAHGAYVINEAYSKVQGWAEGSLQVADEVLEDSFGLARPWSFAASTYPIHLAQTQPAQDCDSDSGGASHGGGGGGASSGGGGSDDVLCFTGDAPLLLADMTVKNLSDAVVGDRVKTGFGDAVGVVTAVLVHPVPGSEAELVDLGGFLGTKSHPVLVDNQWVELADAGLGHALKTVRVQNLYNLEIDGDAPGASNHSYVVGELVASGNGDGHLNKLFPRQKALGAMPPEA